MERRIQIGVFLLIIFGGDASMASDTCDVRSANCLCYMPKLYECPEVNLVLNPVPDGCPLIKEQLSSQKFSNLTCGENGTFVPLSSGVEFIGTDTDTEGLVFHNLGCHNDFYFVVDLDGGQLVKTITLEGMGSVDYSGVFFEFAYGYTVPCNDQPTVNTLLWQYITPGSYDIDANISEVWNRLNFTDNVFEHKETTYFKAGYLFIHFSNVPAESSFKLQMKGCVEKAKDIDEALEYLNNLEFKTERQMQQDGWKINEERHVKRTFVRVEAGQ